MFDGSISQQLIRRIATAIAALTGCYMFGQATGAFIEGASNVALGGPTYFPGVVFILAIPFAEGGLLAGLFVGLLATGRSWTALNVVTVGLWVANVLDIALLGLFSI